MGAASAALTVGFRGNKFSGPNKQQAIAKLLALYRQVDKPAPTILAKAKEIRGRISISQSDLQLYSESFGVPQKEIIEAMGGRVILEKEKEVTAPTKDALDQTRYNTFKVYKGIDGRSYWVSHSSTAYRDLDGEIVSTKSLERAVDANDASGDYGPLDYWHLKGSDIGTCTFQMVHGRVLIEAGDFKSESIAEKVFNMESPTMSLGKKGGKFYYRPSSKPNRLMK